MLYKQGTIYRIVCLSNPDIQYIGSTFNELRHRWQEHIKDYSKFAKNNKKRRIVSLYPYVFKNGGMENFKILPIKSYVVCCENSKDKKHLFAYEQLWINKLNFDERLFG